jgi:predicted nucleic acid-binding protein
LRFIDASALDKRYVRERGSTGVDRLLRGDEVAVSRLSEVEVVSAFARLSREGALTTIQRNNVVDALQSDLASWTVVEITAAITSSASHLLLRHALRSADAIQLACALLLHENAGGLDAFVAHDVRLVDAARVEGLTVRR